MAANCGAIRLSYSSQTAAVHLSVTILEDASKVSVPLAFGWAWNT
ncbi:hypothetical protein N8566_01555 [Verrucomicrobia bacterium]|nr:hypothetical protein [Verrucomicrobiota bacterium]